MAVQKFSIISHLKWSWAFRSIWSVERYLEHGRLSQNLNIGFSLNFSDSKMGKRVTYCASLDEFLYAKFGISHKK